MLDTVLGFFAAEINAYLRARTGITGNVVTVSGLVDETGKYVVEDDRIAITIINIQEETALKQQLPEFTYSNGRHAVLEPALKLNLSIMFAARFTVYEQALKYISHILTFFQGRPVFTPETYPGLGNGIERLSADLQTLSYDELNQIWAFIGAKHLPSIVYRVRLVSVQDQAQTKVQPPLTIIETVTRTGK